MDSKNHYNYMKIALEVAESALQVNEVPVAAILVSNKTGKVLSRKHNMTNKTLNGTKHAEFMIYQELLEANKEEHLKLWENSTLYVTVEPCIMCASMLDQLNIKMVVFGCPNERFGGNGSVFNINYKSNYTIVPGVGLKNAIGLLRKFYILENDKSPTSINKKKRSLNLQEFPKMIYSKFISPNEFDRIWGQEFHSVYENNDFLEFDENGLLVIKDSIESPNKRKKLPIEDV